MRIVKRNASAEEDERRLMALKAENAKLRSQLEYVALMDYPEILDNIGGEEDE